MNKICSIILTLVLICSCLPVSYAASENIALGKPTFASSIYNASYPETKVNDGSTGSAWANGPVVKTGPKGGYEYVAVDLGKEYIITKVIARSRRDMERAVDRTGWVLQVSNDPEFENGVVTIGTKVEPGEFGSDLEVTADLEMGYRYVRLASMNSAVVSELEVYGEEYIKLEKVINSYPDIQGTELDGKVRLLQYLEIIDLGNAKSYDGQTVITRAEACDILSKLGKLQPLSNQVQIFEDVPVEHKYAGVISTCYEYGMISDAQNFNPESFIRPIDFLKMLEILMGYKEIIQEFDGYPQGVFEVARQIDLYISNAEYMNREIMAEIVFSALCAPCLEARPSGVTVTSSYGDSMLAAYYDMNIYKGYVSKNSVTGLTQANYDGDIEISGESFSDNWGSIDDLIGRNIYYITSDEAPTELLYYWEDIKSNKVLKLKSEDIQGLTGTSLMYYKGDRTSIAELSNELHVILNGAAYNSWTEADFLTAQTDIMLIDGDKDGDFETALIEKPQVIVVRTSRGDKEELLIKSKNNSDLSLANLSKITVFKNGRSTTLDSVEENNLVMAYVSADNKIAKFEITANIAEGIVTGSSGEGMSIDGTEYSYSDYYISNSSQTSYVGKKCTLVLNKYNEIIYIQQFTGLDSETQQLGFIAAINTDASLDAPKFKIYVKDGVIKQEWFKLDNSRSYYIDVVTSGMKIYDCATKVIIDGVSKTHADIANIIQNNPRQLLYRMVYFKTNKDGELKQLIIDSTDAEAELHKMSVSLDGTKDVFMVAIGGIFRYNQMILPLQADSPVFTIPTVSGVPVSGAGYDDYYSVSTARSVYGNYAIITSYPTFYQPDEFGYPAFSVRLKDVSEISGVVANPINNDAAVSVLVREIAQVVEDGEISYKVIGTNISTGIDEEIFFEPETKKIYDGFKIATEKSSLINRNGYANKLSGTDLDTYTVSVEDLNPGDLIRYTNVGSIDGKHVSQAERVFTYNTSSPLASYTSIYGALRSMSTGGQDYPASKFRMTYGTAGLYNGEKLTINISSEQANKEVIDLASVYKFYNCEGKFLTPMTRYDFTDCITDNTKILTVVSNYGYTALIAYQY